MSINNINLYNKLKVFAIYIYIKVINSFCSFEFYIRICYNVSIMRKRQDEEKIYEAALKQFSKNGYKKTTLEDIAGKLNMTNANLYGYASSKQALYHDSVAYAMTKRQAKVYDATKDISDPVEKLTVLCDSAVLYLSEDKVFCNVLKADPDIFPMFPTVDPYEEINKRSY